MKLRLIAVAISASALLNACSPKSKSSDAPAQSAEAADDSEALMSSEHCIDDKASACFIEKEVDGREQFYTTAEYNKTWLTNAGIQEQGMTLQVISKEEYNKLATESLVPRMIYGQSVDVNLDVVNADGSPKALEGRDDSANILPLLGLARNAGKLKKVGGLLKGAKGAGKLKGVLSKSKKGGIFSKMFGKRKSGGGFFKDLAINLGLGVLFSGLAGSGEADAGKAKNARADYRTKSLEIPYGMRIGADNVQEDVTID